MESNEVAPALRDLERAEAAPYVDYPATPTWYPLAAGVWFSVFVYAFAIGVGHWLTSEPTSAAQAIGFSATMMILVAIEVAFFNWYFTSYGAVPSLRGNAPPEIRDAFRRYFVGLGIVVPVIIVAAVLAGPLGGAMVALVLVTGGAWLYERRYEVAAEAVKARLQ